MSFEILVVHIMRSICLAPRLKTLHYLVALAGGERGGGGGGFFRLGAQSSESIEL